MFKGHSWGRVLFPNEVPCHFGQGFFDVAGHALGHCQELCMTSCYCLDYEASHILLGGISSTVLVSF
jgi:hypothetical protein